jgi:thioredoxin reductase (NADPH)
MKQHDLIILGAGPSGLAAAVNAASEGLSVLVYGTRVGGQAGASALIENYPGFEFGIPGDELTMRMARQAERFGAMILEGIEATMCHRDGPWHVCVARGMEDVASKALVAATGIKYRTMDIPGIELPGVLVGAAAAEAPKHRGQDVFIVGGGNSAGQAAVHFARYARSVTLLVRGSSLSQFMSSYLVDKLHSLPNVKVLTSVSVKAVQGNGRVEALTIETDDGAKTIVPCDALIIHIGGDPASSVLAVACDPLGYVLTGSEVPSWTLPRPPLFLESQAPGLFVAGDVRHNSVKRCTTAVGDGAMAVQLVHAYLKEWKP